MFYNSAFSVQLSTLDCRDHTLSDVQALDLRRSGAPISNRCKTSEKKQKNQESRVEHPIIDWFVSLFVNSHPRRSRSRSRRMRTDLTLVVAGKSCRATVIEVLTIIEPVDNLIKPVSVNLHDPPSRPLYPLLPSTMAPQTFVLRQLRPPVLRLHFSSPDVRETTLYADGEPTYRYKVSTSRPTSHSGNKVTTVSDSRGSPVIVFRWNTYKRDEIEWVGPRKGPSPTIKRPLSTFFKVGR